MLLSFPPGLAEPSPEKELLSSTSLPLGQHFVFPRGNKLLPLNSSSGQLDLPTEGGQLLLQIAPGNGLLRSKISPTTLNDVLTLGELEKKELVVDGPESGEQVCTTKNRPKVRERRGGN